MFRIYFSLLLALFSTTSTALDLTLLYGHQDGGWLNHIDTDSRLKLVQSSTSGFILGRPLSANQDLELFYSKQQSELKEGNITVPPEDLITIDIHYLHLGGTVFLETYQGIQGFLSGGLGMTRFSPSLSGAPAENRPSMSFGVGARWMPVKGVGLRLESRFYGTLFNSNTLIFCSGGCQLSVSGDLLTQYAIFAGVVVRLN